MIAHIIGNMVAVHKKNVAQAGLCSKMKKILAARTQSALNLIITERVNK